MTTLLIPLPEATCYASHEEPMYDAPSQYDAADMLAYAEACVAAALRAQSAAQPTDLSAPANAT